MVILGEGHGCVLPFFYNRGKKGKQVKGMLRIFKQNK